MDDDLGTQLSSYQYYIFQYSVDYLGNYVTILMKIKDVNMKSKVI